MKKLSFFALLFTVIFLSCNPNNQDDPGGGGTTTIQQDKDFINAKITETLNCLNDIKNGEAIKALITFLKLNGGEVQNEQWIETMTTALENTALNDIIIDETNDYKFNFTEVTGNYTWDRINERYNVTPNSSSIIINFPATPTTATNNITINVSKYTDKLYQANAENVFLPTAVTANITRDGNEIFNLNYTGEFNTVDFPTPKKVTLTINTYPQTYIFNINQLNPTDFSVAVDLLGGTDCKTEIRSTVKFLNSDFKNFDDNNDVSQVSLSVKKGELNINGILDAQALDGIEDPSTSQINNSFTCDVLRNSSKIGELKFKDVNSERKVYIFYKDFSSEDVTVYTDRFINGLESIMEPYFGEQVFDWFD